MEPVRVGEAQIRFWMLATDSDLPSPLGVLAEVTTPAGARRYRNGAPTEDTADDLRDRHHLAFEHGPDGWDEIDQAIVDRTIRDAEQEALR